MQARTLPTARGWAWIVDGFALWRRNPALITFLVFGMSLSLLLVAAVPFIGRVAMSLVAPALSLGVFNGCKAVAERRKVGPDILFSGFRQNLPEQIKIGGLYLIYLGVKSIRSARRKASGKSGTSTPISRWLIVDFLCWW